jgi:hypothetical protein
MGSQPDGCFVSALFCISSFGNGPLNDAGIPLEEILILGEEFPLAQGQGGLRIYVEFLKENLNTFRIFFTSKRCSFPSTTIRIMKSIMTRSSLPVNKPWFFATVATGDCPRGYLVLQ